MSVEPNAPDFNRLPQDSDPPKDRYYTRAELAEVLRHRYGFPVSKNMLDKEACNGIGPVEYGRWGNRALYTLDEALRWARARFRRSGTLAA
jgi:hypothetical protein